MIVDSSAVVAVLLREAGHEELLPAFDDDGFVGIGAPTLVETGIVLASRLGPMGRTALSRFLDEVGVAVVDFTADHWPVAVEAYRRYGKGRHPASLNFGDCLTYAIAHTAGQPLLCVGNDFAQTDLEIAV